MSVFVLDYRAAPDSPWPPMGMRVPCQSCSTQLNRYTEHGALQTFPSEPSYKTDRVSNARRSFSGIWCLGRPKCQAALRLALCAFRARSAIQVAKGGGATSGPGRALGTPTECRQRLPPACSLSLNLIRLPPPAPRRIYIQRLSNICRDPPPVFMREGLAAVKGLR